MIPAKNQFNSYHLPMENENDLQEVQPDETEQESENPELESLRRELAEKDEQIANLSKLKRELKKEVKEVKKSDSTHITKQTDDLDWGEKSYLRASGIEPLDFDFVQEQMRESGIRDIGKLIENPYFKTALKEQIDARAVKEATPSKTRGSSESTTTKVDYWIARGELPPNNPENAQLRRDVVNRRLEIEQSSNKFGG
jgi:uncharacterized protein (DUF3084 family)